MAHLLANPPCEVRFAGFVSDTYQLGHNGWDFSIEDHPYYNVKRMLLRHAGTRLVALAECRNFDVLAWRQRGQLQNQLPTFVVYQLANDIRIQHTVDTPFLGGFSSWADNQPTMLRSSSIYEHPLFLAKAAPKAEQLIVEPEDVMSLLTRIKEMQSPEQAAIRKRNQSAIPVAHATILSFG